MIVSDAIINDQFIERQALILEIVKNQAPIKSEEELRRNIDNPKSPINRLSPTAKDQFLNSIVFTENGVGGFLYGPLLELPKGDIYRIAKLFGVQFELSILDPNIFGKGDRNTYSLLSCDGDTNCFDDSKQQVCVQWDNGDTSCEPLPLAQCFSGC